MDGIKIEIDFEGKIITNIGAEWFTLSQIHSIIENVSAMTIGDHEAQGTEDWMFVQTNG